MSLKGYKIVLIGILLQMRLSSCQMFMWKKYRRNSYVKDWNKLLIKRWILSFLTFFQVNLQKLLSKIINSLQLSKYLKKFKPLHYKAMIITLHKILSQDKIFKKLEWLINSKDNSKKESIWSNKNKDKENYKN